MKPGAWFVLIGFFLLIIGPRAIHATGVETLPAGTILNVRTAQPIEADYAHVGLQVHAVVDDPVSVGGRIVIPRGTPATLEVVRVERSSNLKGRDRITLKMHSIRIGNRTYQVATNYVEFKGRSEGKRTARKVGIGAGVGAAVGGIFGGGTGAAIGAATGGATGGIVAGSGKKDLYVAAETRIQFRLESAVRIQ
jgi:hypothetical protein